MRPAKEGPFRRLALPRLLAEDDLEENHQELSAIAEPKTAKGCWQAVT